MRLKKVMATGLVAALALSTMVVAQARKTVQIRRRSESFS